MDKKEFKNLKKGDVIVWDTNTTKSENIYKYLALRRMKGIIEKERCATVIRVGKRMDLFVIPRYYVEVFMNSGYKDLYEYGDYDFHKLSDEESTLRKFTQ